MLNKSRSWKIALLLLGVSGHFSVIFAGELVNVRSISPPPIEEIRYATSYNFTKTRLYPIAAAFLHRDTARALSGVQRDLAKAGLGLKIYDGYRPPSAQRKMWNLIQDARFVSPPGKGGHTRGTAVDVTLVDANGKELPMPSHYDEFSQRAYRNYNGCTWEQKRNRKKLETVMTRHGFIPFFYEWWHFDLQGWEKYPCLNISLTNL